VAYRLELPAHASIHPVFHVSQLKKAVGSKHQVISTMPADFALHLAPEQILQSRLVHRGHNQVQQVLVKWKNLPSELATWEDFEALQQEFPRATAWVKQCLKGGGMSAARHPSADESEKHEEEEAMGRPKMENRPRRANPRYTGVKWSA
jgi:hypothetical protein